MKHTLTALAFLLAFSTQALAAGEDKNVTLTDAVTKGMITNPEYSIVANDRRAVDNELKQAKALWAPSVDFLGETGYEHTDTETIDSENLWRNRASLTLTQLLFDGYGTRSEIRRQTARVNSTASRVDEVAEFVGLDITQAFLEVLRQRDLLAISQSNVEDHLKILETIRHGVEAGTVTDGDVAQADARLASARANMSSIQQELRNAEALYIREAGDTPENLIFPEIPREELSGDIAEMIRRAVTNSPTLNVFEADVDVAKAEYEGSGSTLYPQVDFEMNGTVGNDVSGVEGDETRASALLVMNWNLFRGGADKARQQEFIYRHALAKERRADAARQVEQDVRDTWAGVISSSQRAEQFMKQAKANEKVVAVYLDQFSLDRRTLLDVLDAQNELFVSRSSHVNSLYTEMFGVFRMLALQGRLLENIGVETPREAHVSLKK